METKSMTIKDAAKQMGKCQGFVRAGLRYGVLPFGTAVKMSSKWTYYISPEKFKEYVGINSK
ncbi:MAG: hypothetical protein K0Q48_686 [Bacillota bacterium]|nr:hypothetical protein [Bacillota bacterium]